GGERSRRGFVLIAQRQFPELRQPRWVGAVQCQVDPDCHPVLLGRMAGSYPARTTGPRADTASRPARARAVQPPPASRHQPNTQDRLKTHAGIFGPGNFVWFPEGMLMEHGATEDGAVTTLFITNKPFDIRLALRDGRGSSPG